MFSDTAIFRIGIALFCGILIDDARVGWRWSAGSKPSLLFAIGSAFVGYLALTRLGSAFDASRLVTQIALSAGVVGFILIFRATDWERGLVRAATLWCGAAIGTAAGLGAWKVALFSAFAIRALRTIYRVCINLSLKRLPFEI